MNADTRTRAEAAAISFSESGSAARYARVAAQLPPRAAAELPRDLAVGCHPDRAVLQLEILLQQHAEAALGAFQSPSPALRACLALFACSPWLGQTLLQNPDLLGLLSRPGALESPSWPEDFREQFARFRLRAQGGGLPELLARFKRREYVRIFARELLGLAPLPEITGEISALTDVMIEQALLQCESDLRARYQGWPLVRSAQGGTSAARFSVLSLGKLGGIELNYSSDIDLLYLYDDAEDVGAIAISAREFFTRLAQELTGILSTISGDGPVFRVDLRLRPQGSSGEMVTGFEQALRYYRTVAHDWELQALLKLRPSAGSPVLGREFVEKVQELIYSDELSLAAIRTAAQSLERIRRGATRRGGGGLDVKSGPGGLREIEFAVQCLQRVHGGRERWLRSSGTQFALRKLYEKGHIGDAEFRELTATYAMLRAIEHRLQCRHGAPAHRIPESTEEQATIFGSLEEGAARNLNELKRSMKSASELCARVLRLGSDDQKGITVRAARLGVRAPERLAIELAERSATLARALAAEVGDPTLRGLQRFLDAASTAEQRMQQAVDDVEWIERALPVFADSALSTNILASHPEDIVALFRFAEGEAAGTISDQLRIEWRRAVLRAVGRSLLESRPIWEVLRGHSQSFDRIVDKALGGLAPPGFAVFAVGRLGTCELDVLSDADLLFLRSPELDAEEAGRCAQAMVGMLSGYTREGSVIEVDTRIRPHGSQGPLVCSSRQLAQYFEAEAKPWEALAFGKLRWIAGDAQLLPEVQDSMIALRRRFAHSGQFVSELRQMRKRIADSAGTDSFKGGPGAAFDLDFILGLLESRAGLLAVGLQLPERLAALRQRELLSQARHDELLRAGELFRGVEHAIRMVEGRARKWLPESETLRARVEKILGIPELEPALRQQMLRVRAVFDAIFAA